MTQFMLLDADRVLSKMNQWNGEDAERASSAAETRQEIGEFIEATGYHKKAISDGRKLLKMGANDPEKLWDYLRTFEPLLNDIKLHIQGQTTPDMFDEAEDAGVPVMTDSDEEAAGDGNVVPFDPEIDEETAEFDAAADRAYSGAAE